MAEIFIITKKEKFGPIDDRAVVVFDSPEAIEKLRSLGAIEPMILPPYTTQERVDFIQDYTALIASLNAEYKDHFLWWATDISSKNRYVSVLPDLLQELLEIQKVFEMARGKPVLLLMPSIALHGAIERLASAHGKVLSWPKASFKRTMTLIKGYSQSLLRNLVRTFRFYLRALQARISLRQIARRWIDSGKEYYVIKTFSYHSSWDNRGVYTDSFFGNLPRVLGAEREVLVLSYHWLGLSEFIKRVIEEKTLKILPVEYFLKTSDVFRAMFRILKFHVPIKKGITFRGLDITDILRFELARTQNGIQVFQLLHYDALRNMFKAIKVSTFLFTFENNPWERMCMLSCRHYSPLTKVIGCQHTVVPEAALNMFVHPSEKALVPLPDLILTTGKIPKQILEDYSDYGLVPIEAACALRYEYVFQTKVLERSKPQGKVLLVLDGVEQTYLMLRFVLKQLGNTSCTLKIRCHPALPWDLLFSKYKFDISSYKNVEISWDSLKSDLAWADMIIYWQTTVVLEAIGLGKPVINFKPRDILSYDPLFLSDALKWTVNEQDNLSKVVAEIQALDEALYQQKLQKALEYFRGYFHPVTPATMRLFAR